jgi:hypothetical protein
MKKNVVLISILALAMFSFKNEDAKKENASAVVNKIDGFYIFTDSRPLMAYDTLGVVEAGFISGTQYHTIRTNLIKRSRKKYANADGIILDLRNHGLDQCIVIKFKQ